MRTTRAEAIAAARAEERAANQRLLRLVTHETRTPLQAILGFVGMLGEPRQSEANQKLCRTMIQQEAQRLAWVIDDLCQQVDLDSGRLTLLPGPVEAETLVLEAARRAELLDRDRTLPLRLCPGLPLVYVDAVLVQSILFTLLRNAFRYTAGDLHVELARDPSGGVRIAVRDNGPAFPAELREVLFERLVELPRKHGAWPRAGLGLGLFVARELARRMGGDLWLEEGPAAGNDFCLRLPAAQPTGAGG